ncbi:hypothetical protein CDD83_4969 [Cordyceps sp. RAO-2017]|nr:hypothetical protein CDD83_4969 [Cordyceps sp. RAO-2017]
MGHISPLFLSRTCFVVQPPTSNLQPPTAPAGGPWSAPVDELSVDAADSRRQDSTLMHKVRACRGSLDSAVPWLPEATPSRFTCGFFVIDSEPTAAYGSRHDCSAPRHLLARPPRRSNRAKQASRRPTADQQISPSTSPPQPESSGLLEHLALLSADDERCSATARHHVYARAKDATAGCSTALNQPGAEPLSPKAQS